MRRTLWVLAAIALVTSMAAAQMPKLQPAIPHEQRWGSPLDELAKMNRVHARALPSLEGVWVTAGQYQGSENMVWAAIKFNADSTFRSTVLYVDADTVYPVAGFEEPGHGQYRAVTGPFGDQLICVKRDSTMQQLAGPHGEAKALWGGTRCQPYTLTAIHSEDGSTVDGLLWGTVIFSRPSPEIFTKLNLGPLLDSQ